MKTAIAVALCLIATTCLAAEKLIVLSPHWLGIEHEFREGFTAFYKEKTGEDITIDFPDLGGGTSTILRYIKSNFAEKPDGIGIDLLFGGGTDPYFDLQTAGLLEPHKVPDETLALLAKDIHGMALYDAKGYTWYCPTMSAFGILFNKKVLAHVGLPEPKTWEDAARPEAFSWVGIADPRKSGAAHMCDEIILQACGWDKGWQVLTALGGNARAFSAGAGDVPKDAAAGNVAYGLTIDFYAWRQRAESGADVIGYVTPPDLSVVNGDGLAILKGAPNMRAARLFVDFVMGERGQRLWCLKVGAPGGPRKYELSRFTVMPSLYTTEAANLAVNANPFAWKPTFTYDNDLGSARWALVNDLMGALLIDAHKQLTAAWQRSIKAKTTEQDLPALAALPITEAVANSLVREVTAEEAATLPYVDEATAARLAGKVPWRDQEYRNKCLTEWAAFAHAKYGAGVGKSAAAGGGSGVAGKVVAALVALAVVVLIVWGVRRGKAGV